MAPPTQRGPIVLLALGAFLGLVLAAASLLKERSASFELPDDTAARVNDAPIRKLDFDRLVAGLESDTRQPADAATRRHVLERMIDEELLVQRGLALGLAQADRKVRADLVSGVIAAVTSDAEEREPTADELHEFHRDNRDFFTQPGRLRVRQLFLRVPDAQSPDAVAEQALQAARRLRAGEDFEKLRNELGGEEILLLPDALLPASKLREYVGPTALRAVLGLRDGEVGDPVRSGTGYHVLWRVESEPDQVPEYESIAAEVRAEYRRRSGDTALRAYLDQLRADADVAIAPELR